MVDFARHGLWAVGGGLCSPVVAGCLGGFGCWFGCWFDWWMFEAVALWVAVLGGTKQYWDIRVL